MHVENSHYSNAAMEEFRTFHSEMVKQESAQCHFAYKDKEIHDQNTPEGLGMDTTTTAQVFMWVQDDEKARQKAQGKALRA